MYSLHFSGSKFVINLWRQFHVRNIFRTQVFAGITVFSFLCLKLLFWKSVNYVLVFPFVKFCSLTSCHHLKVLSFKLKKQNSKNTSDINFKRRNGCTTAVRLFPSDTAHLCVYLLIICGELSAHLFGDEHSF